MAVFDITDEGLVLKEYNPAFSIDEIREATNAPFSLTLDLKSFVCPNDN
jgi:acetate CoA/acetoacetate CoA-transferase beta subunit